jgi:hypothetical protein
MTPAAIRKIKRETPWLLPEFDLKRKAEKEYKVARENLLKARKAWKELG